MNIADVTIRLKEKGYRLTPQRLAIIHAFMESMTPLSVNEVWQRVQSSYTDISLDTIYRNLATLVKLDLLHSIASVGKAGARFEFEWGHHHHHHIVCVRCGAVLCLDYCPIDPAFVSMVKQQGFDLVRHDIELFGLCQACKAKEGELGHV
jgi:Fe2+ or Zn2+ uptake regulation protein